MRTQTLSNRLRRVEARLGMVRGQEHALRWLKQSEPSALLSEAGMPPDEWQKELLSSEASQMLLLCSRQAGKSTTAAALALRTALLKPHSPVLLLSPSLRQSGELFRKVMELFHALRQPVGVVSASALRLELTNGSRIVSLPGTEGTVRGFSGVELLVIDEPRFPRGLIP